MFKEIYKNLYTCYLKAYHKRNYDRDILRFYAVSTLEGQESIIFSELDIKDSSTIEIKPVNIKSGE